MAVGMRRVSRRRADGVRTSSTGGSPPPPAEMTRQVQNPRLGGDAIRRNCAPRGGTTGSGSRRIDLAQTLDRNRRRAGRGRGEGVVKWLMKIEPGVAAQRA